ncbi:MAG: hypothetical protein JXJ04_15800 [Spirochaetales bacterium]|nr:hypothetical protein [Spirochaetales bacterium]
MRSKGDSHIKPAITTLNSIEFLLSGYGLSELQHLADLLTREIFSSKEEAGDFLRKQLTTPEKVIQLWKELDSIQQSAVAETLYSPIGLFPQTQFKAKYGSNPDWGKTSPGKKITHPSKLCLFIMKLQIPSELKDILSQFVSPPEITKVKITYELPLYKEYTDNVTTQESKVKIRKIISLNTEFAVMHELPSILHTLSLSKIHVQSSTGKLSKSGEQILNNLFYGGDYYQSLKKSQKEYKKMSSIKSGGWYTILSRLNYICIEDSTLTLTEKGKKLKDMPFFESIKQMWGEWLELDSYDELSRIESIKGQQGKGQKFLTDVTERREVCVNALSGCPINEWISVDDLLTFMLAKGFTFYITTQPETLYITDPLLGHMGYSEVDGWNILETRYAFVFFFEYMATLGLLDIAYINPVGSRPDYLHIWGSERLTYLSTYDGLLYIKINNLGAYCLDLTDTYTPTPLKKVRDLQILANLEIIAINQLNPGDIYFLERFTRRKSDNVWELTGPGISEALGQGSSLPLFIDFLTAKSGEPLPENVMLFLTEIGAKQTALSLAGKAWIINAESPALAQLIVHSSRLKSSCMIANEQTIVVPEESKKEFLKVIHDLGYSLPMRDGI